MADTEKGWKWWIRFVIVPILFTGGGGVYLLFNQTQQAHVVNIEKGPFYNVPARSTQSEKGKALPAPRTYSSDTIAPVISRPDHYQAALTNDSGNEESGEMQYRGETRRAGPLQVQFLGCRRVTLNVSCDALVTNLQREGDYCLYGKDGDVMSRLVDALGNVYTSTDIQLAQEKLTGTVIVCTRLPERIPVRAALVYQDVPDATTQFALMEFTFDVTRSYRGQTSFKAQFRGVPLLR